MAKSKRDAGTAVSTDSTLGGAEASSIDVRRREFLRPLSSEPTQFSQSVASSPAHEQRVATDAEDLEALSSDMKAAVIGGGETLATNASMPETLTGTWAGLAGKVAEAHLDNVPATVLIVGGVLGVFYLMTQDNVDGRLNTLGGLTWLLAKVLFVVAVLGAAVIPLAFSLKRRDEAQRLKEALAGAITGGVALTIALLIGGVLQLSGSTGLGPVSTGDMELGRPQKSVESVTKKPTNE